MSHLFPLQIDHEELTSQPNERAEHLLHLGQMQLLKTEDIASAERLFTASLALSPKNWKLIYGQGLSLLEFATRKLHKHALHLAHKRFKTASMLAMDQVELWESWSYCLSALGAITHEERFLLEALEKIKRAMALGSTSEELHWEQGKVYFRIATHSGEALDIHLAINAYQQAVQKRQTLPSEFWLDFGSAYLYLASQINNMRYTVKAIACYKHAVFLDARNVIAWKCLGKAVAELFFVTNEEEQFSQANECFRMATKYCPNDPLLWFQWAKFCIDAARCHSDEKKLQSCIEKTMRALSLNPKCSKTKVLHAESLGALGKATERIDLMIEAKHRIEQLVQEEENNPEIWRVYGQICKMFGEYFHDLDLLYQAIEKYQTGLSIDRTQHTLWHAMASTYHMIGEWEACAEEFEYALRFHRKAIDLSPTTHYIIDYAITLAKYGGLIEDRPSLEEARVQFERILSKQNQAIVQHPEWLFHYACALDALGEFYEDETIYVRATECFAHVLMIDPNRTRTHYHFALALSHLGELTGEIHNFQRALHHIQLAAKQDEENEHLLCDWAMILMHVAERNIDASQSEYLWRNAEQKLLRAIRLGSVSAYYYLGCLHALLGYIDSAISMLEKAERLHGLPPLEEMACDEWLDNVRNSMHFQNFIERLEQKQHNQ